MAGARITITLPRDQLVRVQRAVRSGQARSVSGYIASVLGEKAQRDSLRALVDELKAVHGEANQREVAWAKRVLGKTRRND